MPPAQTQFGLVPPPVICPTAGPFSLTLDGTASLSSSTPQWSWLTLSLVPHARVAHSICVWTVKASLRPFSIGPYASSQPCQHRLCSLKASPTHPDCPTILRFQSSKLSIIKRQNCSNPEKEMPSMPRSSQKIPNRQEQKRNYSCNVIIKSLKAQPKERGG